MKLLNKYQRDGLKYMLCCQHPVLFWSMRLRKTLVVIRFIKIKNKYPVLISSPNAAIYEWRNQLIEDGIDENNIEMITGTKNQRKKKLQNDKKIFIINHEGFRSVPQIGKLPFKIVVMDELHQIRNPQTKISHFFTKQFRSVEYRIGLSGTYISENEIDIFQQLKFLDYKYINPFADYWQFRNSKFDNIDFKWKIRPSGKKWIVDKLKKHCNVLDYAEVGINDQLNEIYRYVFINNKVRKQYNDLLKRYILEDDFVQKSTRFAPVSYSWMRQLLSGFVEDRLLNKAKLNELEYLLDNDLKNMQIIIWCHYKEEIKSISNYLNCPFIDGSISVTEREHLRKEFQRKNYQMIVVNSKCYTHGADFSSADGEIYLTLPESGLIFNQSKRRIFSIDDKIPKPCIVLITKDTIEEAIVESHKRKISCKKAIYNYLKRIKNEN